MMPTRGSLRTPDIAPVGDGVSGHVEDLAITGTYLQS
jgi:hypothetical protein